VVPKILGFSAAILATAFILSLPSLFEPEPASEVEQITFGPAPVLNLGAAQMVFEAPPKVRELTLPAAIPVAATRPLAGGTSSGAAQPPEKSPQTVPAGPPVQGSGHGASPGRGDDEPASATAPQAVEEDDPAEEDGEEAVDDDGGEDDEEGDEMESEDGDDEEEPGDEMESRGVEEEPALDEDWDEGVDD